MAFDAGVRPGPPSLLLRLCVSDEAGEKRRFSWSYNSGKQAEVTLCCNKPPDRSVKTH